VALANGQAYFVGWENFKAYLKRVGDSKEVSSFNDIINN
jgi:hypothetical protein